MSSGTRVTFCPICGDVLFSEEPPQPFLSDDDGIVYSFVSPHWKERQVVAHYTSRHRLRWWIAKRWPRVLKWVLTLRVSL